MKKLILLSLIVITAFSACKKSDLPVSSHDRLTGIILGTDTLDMYLGETRQVPLTVSPSDYHLDSIKWSSSDTTVLSISSSGLVKAKKIGTSTVSVSNLTNTISVSALVTVVAAPIDSLKLDLIAYYPFNNSAADSSGNNNNGTATNVTAVADRFGNANAAYQFDGISSFIEVKDNVALRLSNTDFTINTWVYTAAYNASYGSILIDKRGTGSANGWNFGIAGYGDLNNSVGADGIVTYAVSGGSDPYAAGKKIIGINQWHMITTLYSVSNHEISIYVDGVLDDMASGIPTPNSETNADMFIGKDNPDVYNGYLFQGAIDDIRIYGRALSLSEIKKLYTLTY